MSKLPPSQRQIERILVWGRDHPGIVEKIPQITREDWTLTVKGEVEKPIVLKWSNLLELGVEESVSDFHCVEGWSVLECKWEGIPFRRLSEYVKPTGQAKFVFFVSYDGYTTSLPLQTALEEDNLLAFKLDGKWLEPGLGGPVRLIVPKKYCYKSAMWLKVVDFLPEDRLGYWECRGYSNTADPWKNDRWT
jgi:DMSO/TMAO reductase YedYZ molybdopterin-dependent catalytic subunit